MLLSRLEFEQIFDTSPGVTNSIFRVLMLIDAIQYEGEKTYDRNSLKSLGVIRNRLLSRETFWFPDNHLMFVLYAAEEPYVIHTAETFLEILEVSKVDKKIFLGWLTALKVIKKVGRTPKKEFGDRGKILYQIPTGEIELYYHPYKGSVKQYAF